MSNLKKHSLLILMAMLILVMIPMSFAADVDDTNATNVVGINDADNVDMLSVDDNSDVESSSDEDTLSADNNYETTVTPSSVDYTLGNSTKVTVKTNIVKDPEIDFEQSLSGKAFYVYIGNETANPHEVAIPTGFTYKQFNFDLAQISDYLEEGENTLYFHHDYSENLFTQGWLYPKANALTVNAVKPTSNYVYETTPSPASVNYTVGESCVVDVAADYVSSEDDYWDGLDLSGSSMYVYVDGASSGIELSSVDSDAKSFSVDLKDIDFDFVAGETYSLVFRAPNGILSYANVDLADCQFNPLTVTVKAAESVSSYVYETTPSPASVNYTVGESCVVDVAADYVSSEDDYWDGLDLSGSSMYVYVDGASSGIELSSVDSDAKSFSVDLKDIDFDFVAGETYSLVFRAPNGILSYANVDLADCQFNPLTVTVKAAAEPEYLYVSTPSPAVVNYTKGESCNVTFTLVYPDDYDLDEVPISIFFDGSFHGVELEDVDHYAKVVTIDLKDFDDEFEAGENHTVIVRHVNDIMDYNDIGAADRMLNALTVVVKAVETSDYKYESTPNETNVEYMINNHTKVLVNINSTILDQFESYDKLYAWIGEISKEINVMANEKSFTVDLKDLSDKFAFEEGQTYTVYFHPDISDLSYYGVKDGEYKFNPLTIEIIGTYTPEPTVVYTSTPKADGKDSIDYTIGEDTIVTVTIDYNSVAYPSGFDGKNMRVFINDDTTGVVISDIKANATSFIINLADYITEEGVYNISFTPGDSVLSWVFYGVDNRIIEINNLTVNAKVAAPEPEYLYVSTPSPAVVNYTKGESCNVTFTLVYPDDYDLDEVPISIFFDGSFFGVELEDVDHYAKVVTIDLKDFDDEFEAGENHTVIVRHTNDIMDYNDIGAADRLLNALTVVVEAAEPVSDVVYESTPSPASVDYVIGESSNVTVSVVYPEAYAEDLEWYSMYVYINGEEIANRVSVSGVTADVTSFVFDLKDISDKLVVGVNNLTFHPNPGSLEGTVSGEYVFNTLTVNASEAAAPEPEYLYVSTPSPAVVNYTKGESCNVTFTLVYPDDYDLDEVPISIFFDGSFFGDEIEVDHYAKVVTIDLADFASDLTVGNHTVIVRHTNDIMDYNDIGAADRKLNALTVIVEAAEPAEKLNTTMTVEAFANRDGSADIYVDFEDDNVNGNLTLFKDGVEFDSQEIEDDFYAQFHIDHLDKGNYTFKVVFTSEEYNTLEGNDSISVDYGFMYFYVAEEEVNVGENFIALITLPDDANGTVTVTIGSNNYSINVTGGLMQVPIPALEEGSFTVYCDYSGDENYYARSSYATLVVKAAEVVEEYTNYTTTPSESTVNYVIGDNNVITVTVNYNDTYADALGEVQVYVFINNAQEIAISSVHADANSFGFDLKTIAEYLTAGKNTISFGPKLNDLSGIANFTLVLNNLTVNAENAPVNTNSTYVTTPTPSVVYYTLNESSIVTVTVVYDDYFNDDLSMYTMFVYINGEDVADRVAVDGVKGNATTFEFDLKAISDKLVEGQNNLTFHPHIGALEGTFVGPYTFNNLTVTVGTSPEPVSPIEEYNGIIYVDVNGKDTNDGSSSSPVATIAKAIELASKDDNTEHKIIIREGTYAENNLNITSALDIAGEGDVVIDAEKLGRILNINTTADVNISGITFKNGKASSAGAINIKDAKATIDNCVFTENEGSSGAAIVVDADNVKLTNDVFTNNTGRNGAVKVGVYSWSARKSSGSNSVVENCTFDNNHNSIYGNCIGLDIEEGTTGVKIIGSNFTNNKGEAYSEHGTLYIKGDDVVVDDCLFENNTMGMAAAIQIDGENAVIKNSKFINNTADTGLVTRSGAIEVQNAATITGNTFINNGGDKCVQGGAIDIVYAEYGGDIVISDNEFINNSAAKGAAIYVDGGSEDGCEFDSVTIENNTFDGNKAKEGAGVYTATSDAPIDIKNNEFTNNVADEGSAIYADDTVVSLEANTMDGEDIYLYGYADIDGKVTLTFDAPSQASKGETVNVTATLTDDMNNSISGVSVKFTANGKDIGEATTDNGVATVQFNITDAAEYLISGSSDLDATLETATINGILNATIDIPDVSGKTGDKITVPVDVKLDGESVADGNVSVTFGNESFEVPINNGTANVELILPKDAGNYNLTVSYNGINKTKEITVSEAPEKIASVISITLVNGNKITGILSDVNNNPISNETVDYTINGVKSSVTTGSDGTFTIEVQYNVKTDMVFSGNQEILPFNTSITIKDIVPVRQATIIAANDFSQYACDFYEGERGGNFTFHLVDEKGTPLANKTVFIGYNGVTYNRTTDANGYASVQINLKSSGVYTFVIVFLGDKDYNASMAVHKVTINKKPITISASAKTFKATAKTKKYTVTLKTIKGASIDGKTYLAKGKKVTMTINGKTYTAKTNAKGQATFNLKITKKGKFTAAISYDGDSTYKKASAKAKITIK